MSNLKELEKKYEELGKEIERLKGEYITNNDPIFLLSEDEYKKYKNKIPKIICSWWLPPPNGDVAFVHSDGSIFGPLLYCTDNFFSSISGVHPALRISNLKSEVKLGIRFYGDYIVFNGVTWTKIDDDLYISEVPIAFRKFDAKSNDYENSEIRKFLLDWFEERQVLNR